MTAVPAVAVVESEVNAREPAAPAVILKVDEVIPVSPVEVVESV